MLPEGLLATGLGPTPLQSHLNGLSATTSACADSRRRCALEAGSAGVTPALGSHENSQALGGTWTRSRYGDVPHPSSSGDASSGRSRQSDANVSPSASRKIS